jgi:hypothetical protein
MARARSSHRAYGRGSWRKLKGVARMRLTSGRIRVVDESGEVISDCLTGWATARMPA